jgi:SAM-dependent methyltransferase
MFNTRAGVMFTAIRQHVEFTGADVLDLGCGYGDLAAFSVANGARHVTIVDKDPKMVLMAEQKILKRVADGVTWETLVLDLDDRSQLASLQYYHVAFCTSVLPYLKNRDMLLSFLAARVRTSVIEMQYHGDGPGPEEIKSDDDMFAWLTKYWEDVTKIGQSFTGRVPAYRSIWKCERGYEGWQEKLSPRLNKST